MKNSTAFYGAMRVVNRRPMKPPVSLAMRVVGSKLEDDLSIKFAPPRYLRCAITGERLTIKQAANVGSPGYPFVVAGELAPGFNAFKIQDAATTAAVIRNRTERKTGIPQTIKRKAA